MGANQKPVNPGGPEAQPTIEKQDAKLAIKTPEEIDILRQVYETDKSAEAKARKLIHAATPGQEDPNSREYQGIQRMTAKGKSLVEIRKHWAEVALNAKHEGLVSEKEWRQAQADLYEHEGVIPGTDLQIIGALDRIDQGKAVGAELPTMQYIQKRLDSGVILASIRQEAQTRIAQEQQARNSLAILKAGKEGRLSPSSQEYQTYKAWEQQGWTTGVGIKQVEATVDKYDEDRERRKDYFATKQRLSILPGEIDNAREQWGNFKKSLDQQKIAGVQNELQEIRQVQKRPELTETERQLLQQRVVQVMNAQNYPSEQRWRFNTGQSYEYNWQACVFGKSPTEGLNDNQIYKGYFQVDAEDIPTTVEMLRSVCAERLRDGHSSEFKWLVAKGQNAQSGIYAPMDDPEPRIALYGRTHDDMMDIIKRITENPHRANLFRNISEKRIGRARRPGTHTYIDPRTGYEWRAINYNDVPGLSEGFAADLDWRNYKKGSRTQPLK